MGADTKIEWADHTFNGWIGCTKVGPGCDHCYAEALATTRLGVAWGAGAERRRTAASTWNNPRRWDRQAAKLGRRYRVFCSSLADVFDNEVPAEWRADLFALIRGTPNLDWLLVTKRVGNAAKMAEAAGGWPGNVWLGATIVNQAEADRDIPKLLAINGPRFRFLSMEPLLGPVDLTSVKAPREPDEPDLDTDWRFDALEVGDHYWWDHPDPDQCGDCGDGPYRDHRIDWVIVGGESGSNARAMHPDWPRSLRDQCAKATIHGDDAPVPFLFKQWGGWSPLATARPADTDTPGMVAWPDGQVGMDIPQACSARGVQMYLATKSIAGRLLDGVTHDGVPA